MGTPKLPPTPIAPAPPPTPAMSVAPQTSSKPNLGGTFLTGGSLPNPSTKGKKSLLGA